MRQAEQREAWWGWQGGLVQEAARSADLLRRFFSLLIVVLAVGSAYAQPVEGFIGRHAAHLEIDDCPAQTVSGDKLRQIGSEHYQRGEVLYAQGDYRGAVDELAAAYCLAPFYSILKDIGLAYERELEFEKAIAYFERYVMAVPRDAKPANGCTGDPQEDKKNVLARIRVLEKLEAKIRIETEPQDAKITLSSETGLTNRAVSGEENKVLGGKYTITVERAGWKPATRELQAEIGKPYTLFIKLVPEKGKLIVRVVPAEARLYLDRRAVGTGSVETELEGGHYQLVAEAGGRLPETRDVEVFPGKPTELTFEMKPVPQYGRTQFLLYSLAAGGFAGGALAGAQDNAVFDALAVSGGAGAAFAGAYFTTPDNFPLGTSSLTITSSGIGAIAGGGAAALFTNDGNTASPIIGAGLLAGGAAGYYLGDHWQVSPGDAAVINSGALWGTVTGAALAISFVGSDLRLGTAIPENSRRIASGIVLSGLAMGTTGGVLLQRYVTISRAHAALIDASGIVGVVIGFAGLQIYSRATGQKTSDERSANVVLGGLATGLVVGGILTRNIDEQLSVAPSLGRATTAGGGSTTTIGFAGTF